LVGNLANYKPSLVEARKIVAALNEAVAQVEKRLTGHHPAKRFSLRG
jgi:hypothetical protein